jgi:hypothetical protein
MSHSTAAGDLPHNALELCYAETTASSSSELEAHLQGDTMEQFPENHNIVEQSNCQQIGAPDNVSNDSNPNTDPG